MEYPQLKQQNLRMVPPETNLLGLGKENLTDGLWSALAMAIIESAVKSYTAREIFQDADVLTSIKAVISQVMCLRGLPGKSIRNDSKRRQNSEGAL